jgi:hypothetical protein
LEIYGTAAHAKAGRRMTDGQVLIFIVTALCCVPLALLAARAVTRWFDKTFGPDTFFLIDPVYFAVFLFTWFGSMMLVMFLSNRPFPFHIPH